MKPLKIDKKLSEIFKEFMIARGIYKPGQTLTLEERLKDFVYWAMYDYCHNFYNQSRYDFSDVIQQLRDYVDRLDDD